MPRFSRMDVLNAMYETGLVVVFYHPEPEIVIETAKACAAGGARLLEFTNRGDFALNVFGELERYCADNLRQLMTGVGSITEPYSAAQFINSGANFVVGPSLNSEVAKLCNRRKVPYSPGCGSVSEISAAEELGCEILKVFPGAEVGGPSFVKMVKGPMPRTSIMPTGGVEPTEESLTAWFKAGIVCAGIGSQLVSKELLAKHDFAAITRAVEKTVSIIANIKKAKG